MDKETRNRIQRATQAARRLLEQECAAQLEGIFDILPDGTINPEPGAHLDDADRITRAKIVAAIEHRRAGGMAKAASVADYVREAAFTILNRFVALKMLEARGLIQECVSRGEQSSGFSEFGRLAPGLADLPDHGYRLYLECLFDELGREISVLFDRRDPASLLWPRRQPFTDLLAILNAPDLAGVWQEDETIGWVYQYFNGEDERRQMRAEIGQAPRNSRELAVRNQFFTPRYVVQFLTDNTLGPHLVRDAPGPHPPRRQPGVPGAEAQRSLPGRRRTAARGGLAGRRGAEPGGAPQEAPLCSLPAEEGPARPPDPRSGLRLGALPALRLRPAAHHLRGGVGGRRPRRARSSPARRCARTTRISPSCSGHSRG